MSTIPGILTQQALTVYLQGQSYTVQRADGSFPQILQAYKEGDAGKLRQLLSKQETIVQVANATSNGSFEVRSGAIYIDNEPVDTMLNARLIEFSREGLPFQPLVEFVRKLRKNPSFRAVTSLYEFMEVNKHPLIANGNFLAYKRVRPENEKGEMLDIHSGTIDNRPGSEPRMPRNKVNEDPKQTCSYGLHVANWDYACNHFGSAGDVLVEVEVNPEDVVAIPEDYNQSKMRTCGYKVLGIVQNPNPSTTLIRQESNESGIDEEEENDEFLDDDEEDEDCALDREEQEEGEDEDDYGVGLPAAKSDAGSDPLLRAIPTDALRALLATLLDGSDPKSAAKVAQVSAELSRRS